MKPAGLLTRYRYMRISSAVLAVSLLAVPAAFAADRIERPISATIDTTDVSRVVIDIPSSALNIFTDRSGKATVDGTASRSYRNERNRDEAERLIAGANVSLQRRGRTLFIERDLGASGSRFWNTPNATQFDVAITIPEGLPVEISHNAGAISMEGSFGDLDVRIGAGDLTLRMPRSVLAELDASTTVGELRTDLGPRVVEKSGVMAGSTTFINDQGTSKVRLRVRAGTIDVKLTD